MFDKIETLRMAEKLIAHGTQRQKLIAANVANADTPGFKANDLAGFAQSYGHAPATELRASNPRHIAGGSWGMGAPRTISAGGEPAPNGNTVSLEDEVFRIADARREFDLALTITKTSLSLMRSSIGHRY